MKLILNLNFLGAKFFLMFKIRFSDRDVKKEKYRGYGVYCLIANKLFSKFKLFLLKWHRLRSCNSFRALRTELRKLYISFQNSRLFCKTCSILATYFRPKLWASKSIVQSVTIPSCS